MTNDQMLLGLLNSEMDDIKVGIVKLKEERNLCREAFEKLIKEFGVSMSGKEVCYSSRGVESGTVSTASTASGMRKTYKAHLIAELNQPK